MSDSKDLQKELGKLLKTYTEQVNSANAPVETPNMGEDRSNKEYKINFNLLPKELESYLREYVIGQEDSISTIATKICTHFHRMYYEQENPNEEPIVGNIKSNILLIGPTGVGKTYIIKLIADKIGVPFVKADATKFSETGYVGGDVEDLVRELVRKANGQVELAEYGIIYIDEIDKIASITSSHNPDISRSGVQRNLLKIMEESEVDIKNPFDISSQMEIIMEAQQKKNIQRKKINTKNILFIMSGAFNGIEELIGKRLNLRSVGFSQEKTSQDKKNITKDLLKHIKQDDLIEYGFESEFVGRLPVLSVLDTLTEDDFYKILKNPKSSVTMNKKRDFKSYGITLNFEDEALKLVSKLASGEKTGARSLVSLIEEKLVTFEKNLPSTEINELLVTKELIENPRLTLNKLLLKEDIDRIREDFKEHNINLSFDVEALTEIASQSQIENLTPYEYCTKVLKDYKYGLKLLEEKNFEVTKDVIINHKEYLDSFIKSTYKSRKKL